MGKFSEENVKALRAEKLALAFGGVRALDSVSFGLDLGERLAIIGPNGAGKTSLINVISGQTMQTSGHIYFFDQEISRMPSYDRVKLGLARSFQITTLLPNLTVLQNILLAIQASKSCRFQMLRSIYSYKYLFHRAIELLDLMALTSKKESLVNEIGYGEQRKLEIALAIASEPRILILDEPSAGLTLQERNELSIIIRNKTQNASLIIIDHDIDLVFGIADRIIVMHYGRVAAEGLPTEIKTDIRVKEIYTGVNEFSEHAGIK